MGSATRQVSIEVLVQHLLDLINLHLWNALRKIFPQQREPTLSVILANLEQA